MPIYHIQYQGQGKAPDGSTIQLPPAHALVLRGPVVQVAVTVHQSVAQALLQQGQQVPQPVSGLALIDTGATSTCIDDATAQHLGLPVINTVPMTSATHAAVQSNVYPAQAVIAGTNITLNIPQAIGAALAPQGLLLLIGRDILQNCTLHYNGPNGQITLSL